MVNGILFFHRIQCYIIVIIILILLQQLRRFQDFVDNFHLTLVICVEFSEGRR